MKNKSKIIFTLLLGITVITVLFINNTNAINEKNIGELVFKNQWALLNDGQSINGISGQKGLDINATAAWNITLGNDKVIVGILDTGIDISNPKVGNNVFVNLDEIPSNGVDDDKNGFVDDINGWDFYNNDNSVYDGYIDDYHGTLVTSLIVGTHDTNEVWGVAPNVTILPLKFMRGSSGSIDDAIKAIDYAYNIGVRIINCSWDSTEYNNKLYELMKKYKDILFICSSGKSQNNLKNHPIYPAAFDLENVISVVALDNQGQKYEFSGYGLDKQVAAPGKDVLAALPEGDITYISGTSFATAYVTGIAALVKSYNTEIVASDLAKVLIASKKTTKEISNQIDSNGIIDAKACLDHVAQND